MNITLNGISKSFTQRTWRTTLGIGKPIKVNALNNVSLAIPSGEIFGLLGPNGADLIDISQQLFILFVFVAILVPLGLLSFGYGLNIAKKEGSLIHY